MATGTEDLLTIRQAARQARRTAETVRRWVWDGKLPAQKLGNQLFVRRADLERLLVEDQESIREARRAALRKADEVRERIRQRGGNIDVVTALEESRESHP